MNGICVFLEHFLDGKLDLVQMMFLGPWGVRISDVQAPMAVKFGQSVNIANTDETGVFRPAPSLNGGGELEKFSRLRGQKGTRGRIEIEVVKGVPDLGEIIARGQIDDHSKEGDVSGYQPNQIHGFYGGQWPKSSPRTAGSLSQHVMSSFRGTESS